MHGQHLAPEQVARPGCSIALLVVSHLAELLGPHIGPLSAHQERKGSMRRLIMDRGCVRVMWFRTAGWHVEQGCRNGKAAQRGTHGPGSSIARGRGWRAVAVRESGNKPQPSEPNTVDAGRTCALPNSAHLMMLLGSSPLCSTLLSSSSSFRPSPASRASEACGAARETVLMW